MSYEAFGHSAYKNAYQTMDKTKQVVLLFDATVKTMMHAREAIKDERIQDRYNLLTKAGEIVYGLQKSLDFDNGGEISQILYDYYAGIDRRIMSLHREDNLDLCDQVIEDLKSMQSAWKEIAEGEMDDEVNDTGIIPENHEETSFSVSV